MKYCTGKTRVLHVYYTASPRTRDPLRGTSTYLPCRTLGPLGALGSTHLTKHKYLRWSRSDDDLFIKNRLNNRRFSSISHSPVSLRLISTSVDCRRCESIRVGISAARTPLHRVCTFLVVVYQGEQVRDINTVCRPTNKRSANAEINVWYSVR